MTHSNISQLTASVGAVIQAQKVAILNGGGAYGRHLEPALAQLRIEIESPAAAPLLKHADPLIRDLCRAAIKISQETRPSNSHFTALHLAHIRFVEAQAAQGAIQQAQGLQKSAPSAATTALAAVAAFSRALPGAGIQGIGADAALTAMTGHWADHISQGHDTSIIMQDFDELVSLLQQRRNELAAALSHPFRPERLVDIAAELNKLAPIPANPASPPSSLLDATIQRWDVREGTTEAVPGEPEYQLSIEHRADSAQTRISVIPVGASDDPTQLPQLELLVEVNQGLPCVHVYGDVHGDLGLSIFGKPGARLGVRAGDAETDFENKQYSPDFGEVIRDITRIQEERDQNEARERD